MKQYKTAYGITSKCKDGNHIYMGDIDNDIPIDQVKRICKGIQKSFYLSDIHIIKSSHGWNLLCFDKLPLKLIWKINYQVPEIDKVFNRLAFINRGLYVIRTIPSDDKTYRCTIYGNQHVFPMSNAHRIYCNNWLDGFNVDKSYYYDDEEILNICKFKNLKYGWFDDEIE